MARHEIDREDLMRDAVALRQRVELRLAGEWRPLVAGWRDDDRLSLYFGPDPVYHFDAAGRLRRAFVGGSLYRSRGDTLSKLSRVSANSATHLLRHDLNLPELQAFLEMMTTRLESLARALAEGRVEIVRQVPGDADLCGRLSAMLPRLREGVLAPAIRGRR